MSKQQAPYGSWLSPITTDLLTAATVNLSEPSISDDAIYWLESRPSEKGRNVLVCRDKNGTVRDLLPSPLNVRTSAHEYGGGNYCIANQMAYFVLFDDQRLYRLNLNDANALPEAITPEGPWRYADFCFDAIRQEIICVRETHSGNHHEPSNDIVAISIHKQEARVLTSGNDFYSNPRLSPNGETLSWLTWNHPNMPWDETECWLAQVNEQGQLQGHTLVAGGNQESIFQAQWSPDGNLYWVSDRNNWWNIYRLREGQVEQVSSLNAEFATPQWVFGMSTYGFINNNQVLCCFSQKGQWQLALIDTESLELTELASDYVGISALHCENGRAVFLGAALSRPEEIACLQAPSPGESFNIVARASDKVYETAYLSSPEAITFTVSSSQENQSPSKEEVHGFYYPPCNQNFEAPEGDKPPLIVMCHGGPTGSTSNALNMKIQYWTSRGFAILDINYRGSTGFGRTYRDRLKDNWGITDVEDVCAGAEHLVKQGLAHPGKLAIKGGSAGGYTVLAALTFRDTFNAGASHYGIGDLEALAQDTHKFEARYMDRLVGEYPADIARYHERSPIHAVEKLNCPVIFFQGLDDKVVPPNQAEAMVAALGNKGIPTAYVPFEGEGHGFRQGPNIKRALEGELYFYAQIFGFDLAETIEPIKIINAPSRTQLN